MSGMLPRTGLTTCALTLQAYATYSFTFDWVYGPDSFQSEVYDKSAKGTVLSTLQACPSLGNTLECPYGRTQNCDRTVNAPGHIVHLYRSLLLSIQSHYPVACMAILSF